MYFINHIRELDLRPVTIPIIIDFLFNYINDTNRGVLKIYFGTW